MGRRKKICGLTREQIEYRNAILKTKVSGIKVKIDKPAINTTTLEDAIQNKLFYLNNCVFWINKYQDGEVDIKRLMGTFDAMFEHIIELKKTYSDTTKAT